MSKIYIDPLNLGPIFIDTKDFSQCEENNVPSPCEVWKLPRHEEWKKNISKALKGKKAGAGQIAATKASAKANRGKKRPEHSKLMRERYEKGELFMPRGQAKGKRTGQALENIRKGVQKRYNKAK